MDEKDIIRMAVMAGFDDITPWLDHENVKKGTADEAKRLLDKMVKFVAMVGYRVYEVKQEQCAAKVAAEGVAEYERGLKDGAALEREACIEDVRTIGGKFAAECESTIRARGEGK